MNERVNGRTDAGTGAAPGGIPLHEVCGHLLRRAQQVHTALWTEAFGAELTSPQYGVLTVLALHPGIDQKRLGELVSLDKASTADVVSRLSARGWIQRQRDPADARRNILALAPAAASELDHLTPAAQAVQDRLLEPVPEPARPLLLSGLRRLARLDERLVADVGPDSPLVLRTDVPGSLLRRAQQVHTALWATTFGGGITGPQFAAVQVLAQHPGISQRELGERAALDKSTGADVLARLERKGWVRRAQDGRDARIRILNLTEQARDAAESTVAAVMGVQELLLEPVPAAERRDFLAALARVAYSGRA